MASDGRMKNPQQGPQTSFDQSPKPWLFSLYRGLYYPLTKRFLVGFWMLHVTKWSSFFFCKVYHVVAGPLQSPPCAEFAPSTFTATFRDVSLALRDQTRVYWDSLVDPWYWACLAYFNPTWALRPCVSQHGIAKGQRCGYWTNHTFGLKNRSVCFPHETPIFCTLKSGVANQTSAPNVFRVPRIERKKYTPSFGGKYNIHYMWGL